MADAARIVEGMGADIVDVNMGCPVAKIAKHSAGCSLMREPAHAADVVRAMARAVKIPVTVKMRAGWDDSTINAPDLARRMEAAGAAALAVHGRTAAQSYSGVSDWALIATVAAGVSIPVFGSGDCVEPGQVVDRLRGGEVGGVLVGRGALRNPWIFQQAADVAAGRAPREISALERGEFLLQYVDMLMTERLGEAAGFRHVAPGQSASPGAQVPARGHDRWVINKLRALNSWFTKGLDNGSHLRVAVNSADSVAELRAVIEDFFLAPVDTEMSVVSSR
jgi:nifR3 family TIM-barrel protein